MPPGKELSTLTACTRIRFNHARCRCFGRALGYATNTTADKECLSTSKLLYSAGRTLAKLPPWLPSAHGQIQRASSTRQKEKKWIALGSWRIYHFGGASRCRSYPWILSSYCLTQPPWSSRLATESKRQTTCCRGLLLLLLLLLILLLLLLLLMCIVHPYHLESLAASHFDSDRRSEPVSRDSRKAKRQATEGNPNQRATCVHKRRTLRANGISFSSSCSLSSLSRASIRTEGFEHKNLRGELQRNYNWYLWFLA